MSVRYGLAAAPEAARSNHALAKVLAVGNREVQNTGGFLKKSPFVRAPKVASNQALKAASKAFEAFQKAIKENKKGVEHIKSAMKSLTPESMDILKKRFIDAENTAWKDIYEASNYADTTKARNKNMKGLVALLQAHLGLGALCELKQCPAMPNKPEMPAVADAAIWPSSIIRKGNKAWPHCEQIHQFWKRAVRAFSDTSRS